MHAVARILMIRSKGKVGYPWESTPDIYQHIPPRHVLDTGCTGQYGAILGEQLLGYPPPNFPFDTCGTQHASPMECHF